jgi:hypothetical protein
VPGTLLDPGITDEVAAVFEALDELEAEARRLLLVLEALRKRIGEMDA